MIWSTGIEYPYPTHWSQTEYPPKFVLGYYKKNVIESILLARGTTPEYAPHALTFVVDFIAIDPNKNISTVLPVLEKMRNIGISFRVILFSEFNIFNTEEFYLGSDRLHFNKRNLWRRS